MRTNKRLFGKSSKFGSVEWQDEMTKTIKHKAERGEELSPQERCFIPVQVKHIKRMKK